MPSTVITSFDYDAVNETLKVKYVSGKEYNYKKVPIDVYQRMRSSFAKGIFLNRYIKGKYPFEEVKE